MEIKSKQAASLAAGEGKHEELMGAEILVKALQAENVQYIWGYPGGSALHLRRPVQARHHAARIGSA